MGSKAPPIPPDQRRRQSDGKADVEGSTLGRRDSETGMQSEQPGDDDINLDQQGRHGNIRQNTRHQGYQQDR
jgi:hypothetical protein